MGLTSHFDKLKLRHPDESSEDSRRDPSHKDKDTDDIDELDNNGQSILMGIISQLRLGADLSKITLPTFILEKKSMLERITNFFQIPQILLQADETEDGVERFLLMLKWYLASWHIAPKAVKKPLNPILGELFSCYWDELPGGHKAYYVAEQTSHHPPKSSYFYMVPDRKIRVDGVLAPRSKFLGNSSAAIMEGWGHVTLGRHQEVYMMNQPNVYCRGILFGKLRYELGDNQIVKCPKLGLTANIEFKVKGMITGSYDAIEGDVTDLNGKALFRITGKWNDVMYIENLSTGEKTIFFDTNTSKISKPKTRPLEEQADRESRKLWKPTIDALSLRNHELATEEKAKVENEQRRIAKERAESGTEFRPKLFLPQERCDNNEGNLEYVIYKDFDWSNDNENLEEQLFQIMPFTPGQTFEENFDIPAEEKATSK